MHLNRLVLITTILMLPASAALGQGLSKRIAELQKQRQAQQAASDNESAVQPKPGTPEAIIQKLIHLRLDCTFTDVRARDVIGYLATASDIHIVGRYSDDPVGFGIDPETPITINLQDERFLVILEQVLAQCAVIEETTWQLRPGYLEVGTKDRLSVDAARFVKTYPIRDLLHEVPRFDNAIELGLEAVYEESYRNWGYGWRPGYGGGFGGTVGGGGTVNYGSGGYGAIGSQRSRQNTRPAPDLGAEEIIGLITAIIEPTRWTMNGGDVASIQSVQGLLVVEAPDYIHRQIGGYPHVPPPPPEPDRTPQDQGQVTKPAG